MKSFHVISRPDKKRNFIFKILFSLWHFIMLLNSYHHPQFSLIIIVETLFTSDFDIFCELFEWQWTHSDRWPSYLDRGFALTLRKCLWTKPNDLVKEGGSSRRTWAVGEGSQRPVANDRRSEGARPRLIPMKLYTKRKRKQPSAGRIAASPWIAFFEYALLIKK